MSRTIPIHPAQPVATQNGFDATRREALKLMAAGLAMASAGCTRPPTETIYAYGAMPEQTPSDGARYFASAFVREGHAHGVLIATQDGRPIKIEGLTAHPASLGATDIYAQASILQLWDPDRSRTVMQRQATVPSDPASDGDDAATPSSWEAFDNAWAPLRGKLMRNKGRGLYIVTGPFSSPTLKAQLAALLQAMPQARWVSHIHEDDLRAQQGSTLAFGQPLQPVWHFDRASMVLCLGGDPFHGGPASVRHAMDWANQRSKGGAARPQLFVAETAPGLTGARADMRIALTSPEIEMLAWRLADALWPGVAPTAPSATAEPPLAAKTRAFADAVVTRLKAAGPSALIVAGPTLSPETQALVHVMNHRLGCIGRTVEWIEPVLASSPHGLPTFIADAQAGRVEAAWLLGCNPVYESPDRSRMTSALHQVPFSAHMGLHRDETGKACHWHLPESHVYEQWSDALAFDGAATIVQPAIAPLYDSRSLHEALALLSGDTVKRGHDLVQRQWRERYQSKTTDGFDAFWRQALQQGVVAGTAQQAQAVRPVGWPKRPSPAAPLQEAQLLLEIAPDHAVRHGAFSNNGWLQELPRPFTSLTWGNALLLGPETAQRMKLATGDIARVRNDDGAVLDCPVWVLQGHAEGSGTLSEGYGRWAAGPVGNGVGVRAQVLRSAHPGPLRVTLEATGQRHAFAVRQIEMAQQGRELARTVAPGELAEQHEAAEPSRPNLYPAYSYPEHAWAMVVDLDACIGCGACTVACQAENNIPVVGPQEVAHGRVMHWIRVDTYHEPDGDTLFQPVPCMHCEHAPCELVCPVGATMHDSEGLNAQVYNRCIGTRFCSNNCPYKVRRFNFLQYSDTETESLKAMRNPDVTVRERGVMEKCTYCVQRISRARRHEQRTGEPIEDGDVVTACQAACPTRAITFGDLNDSKSQVVQARTSDRHYAMLGELNTRPRTTYLARRASVVKGKG